MKTYISFTTKKTTDGHTTNSEGLDKKGVEELYQSYSDGDNYHLLTKWTKDNQDASGSYAANGWVEFRIIQVGEHDGDGSVITFMATHSLPEAKCINENGGNSGGWYSSDMRGYMTSYVANYLPNLSPSVLSVYKVDTEGSHGSWRRDGNYEKFWLISVSELSGGTYGTNFQVEGSQYAWFVGRVSATTSGVGNPIIADLWKTRAGHKQYGADNDDGTAYWWERSPYLENSGCFGRVYWNGYVNGDNRNGTKAKCGVVPCFAM